MARSGNQVTGYLHERFANSFSEFGRPRLLPRSGGWILERTIPGSSAVDAMGCYPLFACHDWSALAADLTEVAGDLVSLSLVADPYGEYTAEQLRGMFDVVTPFKEHFLADFSQPYSSFVSKRHQRRALASLEHVTVEAHPNPAAFLDDWNRLYGTLIARHRLRGVKALSPSGFVAQLAVPGSVVLTAVHQGKAVGAHLYYVQGDRAYCHLAAFDDDGYELLVSFALQWRGIEYFSDKVRLLGLGAGAGVVGSDNDGLTQFKRGWASGTRTAYFCGRVFNRRRYDELVAARQAPATSFFPAYRAEFG